VGLLESLILLFAGLVLCCLRLQAQTPPPPFKVIAFYTGKSDQAHISFVREANPWFAKMAGQFNFTFVSTTNWN
jgi:hypothetical protein